MLWDTGVNLGLLAYSIANVGEGWFAATEKSDYIQAIGLSSAKFQQLSILVNVLTLKPSGLFLVFVC